MQPAHRFRSGSCRRSHSATAAFNIALGSGSVTPSIPTNREAPIHTTTPSVGFSVNLILMGVIPAESSISCRISSICATMLVGALRAAPDDTAGSSFGCRGIGAAAGRASAACGRGWGCARFSGRIVSGGCGCVGSLVEGRMPIQLTNSFTSFTSRCRCSLVSSSAPTTSSPSTRVTSLPLAGSRSRLTSMIRRSVFGLGRSGVSASRDFRSRSTHNKLISAPPMKPMVTNNKAITKRLTGDEILTSLIECVEKPQGFTRLGPFSTPSYSGA